MNIFSMETISRTTKFQTKMKTETMSSSSESATVGEYVLQWKLGGGSFSIVWKAQNKLTGEEAALKQVFLSKLNHHLKTCLDCELNFLSSVKHPNIIRLIHVLQGRDCLFLVMEFCNGGNLASLIQRRGKVEEQTARRYIQQLGAGLEVLHSNHIIHRDLKPENILISGPEDDAVLKIADFGLSRTLRPGEYVNTVCGSPYTWLLKCYSFKVMMRRLTCGALAQFSLNFLTVIHHSVLLQNIKSSKFLPFSQLILPQLHQDCIDMCSRLLSIDPANRLSFNEFYWHKFMRGDAIRIYNDDHRQHWLYGSDNIVCHPRNSVDSLELTPSKNFFKEDKR